MDDPDASEIEDPPPADYPEVFAHAHFFNISFKTCNAFACLSFGSEISLLIRWVGFHVLND